MMPLNLLPLERIEQLAQKPQQCTRTISIGTIDFTKPFIHERLTQLYYTPHYQELNPEQKLRYNQLFAIRTNEQFMIFEKYFTNRVLAALRDQAIIKSHPLLERCMAIMILEEHKHHDGFARLNRHCLPSLYVRDNNYFNRLPWLEDNVFRLVTRFPNRLVFLLWYLIALEEYSLSLSRHMFESRDTALGELEPHFVAIHQEHFKDEARHIHLNLHLVQHCLPRSKLARRINASLFLTFLKDLITPKRSGLRVLQYLVSEFPELRPKLPSMSQSLKQLKHQPEFLNSMFSRQTIPRTLDFFDQLPELEKLQKIIPGTAPLQV